MTHCSLVSLVRLVQVHLALVPLKPSSGPLYPLPPLSLCPAKFHFNIATATKGYDQISPWLRSPMHYSTNYLAKPKLTKTSTTLLSPPLNLCIALPIQDHHHLLGNLQSYQGSTHPLCSGPWPSCCQPRSARTRSYRA